MGAALFHQGYHTIILALAIADLAVAIANIHCHHPVVQRGVVDLVGLVVLFEVGES
jgi:hypothetical protein